VNARDYNGNGHSDNLSVVAVTLEWSGKKFKLDIGTVTDAFYNAPYGAVLGPNARWFIEFDGDMKSMIEVLKKIIPVDGEEITKEMLELFTDAVESLGFKVLDRQAHHCL